MSNHAVKCSSYCFHVSFKTLLSTCWLYSSKTNGSRSRVKVLCFSSWGGFSPSTGIAFVANTVDVASFDEVVVCDASFLVEVVAEALKLDISEAAYDDYMTMACNATSPISRIFRLLSCAANVLLHSFLNLDSFSFNQMHSQILVVKIVLYEKAKAVTISSFLFQMNFMELRQS